MHWNTTLYPPLQLLAIHAVLNTMGPDISKMTARMYLASHVEADVQEVLFCNTKSLAVSPLSLINTAFADTPWTLSLTTSDDPDEDSADVCIVRWDTSAAYYAHLSNERMLLATALTEVLMLPNRDPVYASTTGWDEDTMYAVWLWCARMAHGNESSTQPGAVADMIRKIEAPLQETES